MTKIIESVSSYQELYEKDFKSLKIGFVPTMGALHDGHISLLKQAQKENDISICSIFVNPTQFNNQDDLAKYPKTFRDDLKKLESVHTDFLFYPNYKEVYPDSYRYRIQETEFSKSLCGQYRQGHFDGVLTVVMKLFNIIRPTKAYFGEKDYQQLKLIQDMAKAFFMNVDVVAVPTVRDRTGLALSSRNARLSPEGLKKATLFAKLLQQQKPIEEIKKDITESNIEIEYLEEVSDRKFAAVYIEGVRLIDNISIS